MVQFILGLLIGGSVGFCIAVIVSVNNSNDVIPSKKKNKERDRNS